MADAVPRAVRAAEARKVLGGIGNTTLWRWVRERQNEGFPQPNKIGPRVTVFNLDELVNWRDAQTADKVR